MQAPHVSVNIDDLKNGFYDVMSFLATVDPSSTISIGSEDIIMFLRRIIKSPGVEYGAHRHAQAATKDRGAAHDAETCPSCNMLRK